MITIVLPDLRGGGAERVSIELARAFSALGHDVEFVLVAAAGDFLPEVHQEFPVVDLGVARARNAFRPLAAYLRTRRPKAVVAMMWPLTAIVPCAAKVARYGGPVLVCEHGILSQQYEAWGYFSRELLVASVAIGYRLASARVGVSSGVAADMAQLAGLAKSQVISIHNPIRPLREPSAGSAQAADALWNTRGPRILTVGNIKPVKNHSLLLRAFARLPRPDARLMLLGQGQDEAALRTLAAELDIADRVIFAGFHADPAPFYATADLFVLSSDHEGFGNVIVESLSFGLPVVSTDCPTGPAEILENGRWGRLVPLADPDLLSQAMAAALATPADRSTLKRRAADFSPLIAARKYLDLLGLS